MKINFAALATILLLGQTCFADYAAYCVHLSGERLSRRNLFSANDTYFRLDAEKSIFVVQSASEPGLALLCPNGTLVSGFRKVWIPEQMTPRVTVTQGMYLKNPTFYQSQAHSEYEVVTDKSVGTIR